MKLLPILLFSFALSCGAPAKKVEPIISDKTLNEIIAEEPSPEIETEEVLLPVGATTGAYSSAKTPFYAFIQPNTKSSTRTTIDFEDQNIPNIEIPDTYGGQLYSLSFPEFDRDLLLIAAKMKDPIFIKYHLFIYRDSQWRPVVEPFTLHISHTENNFIPIEVDTRNSNQMFRHYSVFDLDKESEVGFTWRLLTETVDILNR